MRANCGAVWLWASVSFLCVVGAPESDAQLRPNGQAASQPEVSNSQSGETAGAAAKSVPRLLRFTGALKDQIGNPLTGTVGVTFALYKDSEGGSPLWLETQSVEPDGNGNYTVLLGANSPKGVPAELFTSNEARWLGVQVGQQPEHERILLVSMPYALKAGDAETLGGKPASAYLTTGTLASTGTSGTLFKSSAAATRKKTAFTPQPATPCTSVTSDGTAAVGSISLFTAPCLIQSSVITQSGALVGIGTATPAVALDVVGNNAGLRLSGMGTHQITVTGATSGRLGQDANGFFFASDTNSKSVRFLTNNGTLNEWMRISGAGNVGIGTVTPTQRLEIAGNVKITGAGNGLILPDNTVRTSATSISGTLSVAGPLQITGAGNGILVKNAFGTQCKQIGIDNTGSIGATLVPCLTPRFAYVTNYLDSTVSIFAVDAASGQLRPNGYVFLGTAINPYTVAVDPSGKFVYVANQGNIWAFSVTTSGALTAVPGSPFGTGIGPNPDSVAVDPSGRFLYVTTGADVPAFTIDPTSGALTQILGSPYGAGNTPDSVTVDPSGRFVYVANFVSNDVSAFTINATSGALTAVPGSPFGAGTAPNSVSVDPSGRFVYMTNRSSGNVSGFTINATSGVLTPIPGSPFAVPGGTYLSWVTVEPSGKFAYVRTEGNCALSCGIFPFAINPTTGALAQSALPFPGGGLSLTVDPSGKFVYASSATGYAVSEFTINPTTGALTQLAQSPIAAGREPGAIAISTGPPAVFIPQFAYVANANSNNVSAFTINPTSGALTPVPGSPFAAGLAPTSVTVDLAGKFAYVTNSGGNNVSAFTINPTTGALSPVSGSPFAAGTSPESVTVDSSGRFAYVSNATSFGFGNVSAFAIDPTSGALSPVSGSPFNAGTNPYWVTLDHSGRFAYVANSGSNNVTLFDINSIGQLSQVAGSPFAAGNGPRSVTLDGTGSFAYVANRGSNNVSAFTVDPLNGPLTPISGSPFAAGTAPNSVATDPAGKFAFVANVNSNNVSAFSINASSGALTAVPGSPFAAGSFPISVTVDPSGKFAYVANFGSKNVSVLSIDPTTGALTPVPGSPFAAGSGPISVVVTGKIQ